MRGKKYRQNSLILFRNIYPSAFSEKIHRISAAGKSEMTVTRVSFRMSGAICQICSLRTVREDHGSLPETYIVLFSLIEPVDDIARMLRILMYLIINAAHDAPPYMKNLSDAIYIVRFDV